MTATATAGSPRVQTDARPTNWRHGVQLAIAVLVSYLASAALGLPESLWAVMSALIVMRPTAGSTLGAGWERMRGTLAGTLFGLGGVWLHHIGVATPLATLGIVALLALSSARFPAMRSAPITALIVLSSGGMAGQPALRVALLRVMEIAIGVATGLAISLIGLASHARARFDTACAAMLRHIAGEMQRDLGTELPAPQQKEAAAAALRLALRELALLAVSADREARLLRRPGSSRSNDGECARTARLIARIAQDAALFTRLVDSAPLARDDAAWRALALAAGRALETTADSMESEVSPDLNALRRFCAQGAPGDTAQSAAARSPIPWVAPAARLLMEDLAGLARLRAAANATA
ncbi:putative membrane protein [Variovorax sp. SRS16]|nr:putative membrane protein [Variovorax sp. SRS16]